ncbi:MAG: hypothetical protein K1Y36_04810 [Blastocatellia bacterium]|nr:hypothetical protein [Blastocatellia bacterium]
MDTVDKMDTTSERDNIKQYIILKHALLAGLTPLIPIPLVDDWVKAYLLRRQVRKLAAFHNVELDPEIIKTLADEPETGCLTGCLASVLVLPLKLIFRKVFVVLEWKRAVDTLSRVYHRGYLLECALDESWYTPQGAFSAAELRTAIDTVCTKVKTDPIEHALAATFRKSKDLVTAAVGALYGRLRKIVNPTEAKVTSELELLQIQDEPEIKSLVERFQQALQKIPKEHFLKIRQLLANELAARRALQK